MFTRAQRGHADVARKRGNLSKLGKARLAVVDAGAIGNELRTVALCFACQGACQHTRNSWIAKIEHVPSNSDGWQKAYGVGDWPGRFHQT